jgi:hypothetical protein
VRSVDGPRLWMGERLIEEWLPAVGALTPTLVVALDDATTVEREQEI